MEEDHFHVRIIDTALNGFDDVFVSGHIAAKSDADAVKKDTLDRNYQNTLDHFVGSVCGKPTVGMRPEIIIGSRVCRFRFAVMWNRHAANIDLFQDLRIQRSFKRIHGGLMMVLTNQRHSAFEAGNKKVLAHDHSSSLVDAFGSFDLAAPESALMALSSKLRSIPSFFA